MKPNNLLILLVFALFAVLFAVCAGCLSVSDAGGPAFLADQYYCGTSIPVASTAGGEQAGMYLSWENKNERHNGYTDAGNYLLIHDDVSLADFDKAMPAVNDIYASNAFSAGGCTATVKRNAAGEVVFGRNMDVDISQSPAVVSFVTGGKYPLISFSYAANSPVRYTDLAQADNDTRYVDALPFISTDAFNSEGLYVEINMREHDNYIDKDDALVGKADDGRMKASVFNAPVLIAANAGTVAEAVAYAESVCWCPLNFNGSYLNMAVLAGDAEGNFGLIEFAYGKVYYTPYVNGQANYYIHPMLAEYATIGTGYGRFAAALEHLDVCESEYDMMHNMENAFWGREILSPGCMGYSDYEEDIVLRCNESQENLQKEFVEYLAPKSKMIEEYYRGNETALRNDGTVWTSSFNFGVNCAKKHLILRLWERENLIVEYQW